MTPSEQIASVIAGLSDRAPQMRALFAIDIPADRSLATMSIAPTEECTPQQRARVHAAMTRLRDAIADVVLPRAGRDVAAVQEGVLEVMDTDGRAVEAYVAGLKWDHANKWSGHIADRVEARAAVAELIDAARKAESFISIAVPTAAVDRTEAVCSILPALRAALARVGGTA